MLSHRSLPLSLIERCLDILKEIVPSERELIRIVVEIIIELREDGEAPLNEGGDADADADEEGVPAAAESNESFATMARKRSGRKDPGEMTEAERRESEMMDLRCLIICSEMLGRVNGVSAPFLPLD
jgi:condensin complex subunit 3